MKSILLTTIILLCISVFAIAQTNKYFPFPQSGGKWSGEYDYCFDCDDQYPVFYKFGFYFRETRDTVINSLTYHLINFANTYVSIGNTYTQKDTAFNLGPPFAEINCGALREDSTHLVYYRCFNNILDYGDFPLPLYDTIPKDTDILLYDFNLKTGDTVPARMYAGVTTYIIIDNDSTSLKYGSRTTFLVVDSNTNGITADWWVEGMGSSKYGLLSTTYYNLSILDGEGNILLNCFSINDTVLYPPVHDGSCDTLLLAGIKPVLTIKQSLQLFPNPVTDKLYLKFSQGFNAKQITIYNYLGQQVYSAANTQINSIDVTGLAAGLYFIRVMGDERVFMNNFVKE